MGEIPIILTPDDFRNSSKEEDVWSEPPEVILDHMKIKVFPVTNVKIDVLISSQ